MPSQLLQELHVLCRRQNVTLFMTLLATWATLLHRYSGEEDILIGTYTANRNRHEVERLVGCFTSYVLVLRHDLGGDPSFTALLKRVRETALDAFSHSELPEEILLKELYVRCDIVFTLQTTSHSGLKLDGLQVERIKEDLGRSTPFLKLAMIQGDEDLTARLTYNSNIFEAATIQRMLGDLQSLLEGIVADPEQRVSGLALLTEDELPAPAGARRWGSPVRPAKARSWSIRFRKRLRWAYDTLEEGPAHLFELDRPGRWWEVFSRESNGFSDAYCPRWRQSRFGCLQPGCRLVRIRHRRIRHEASEERFGGFTRTRDEARSARVVCAAAGAVASGGCGSPLAG
jgi:hypothetical protein